MNILLYCFHLLLSLLWLMTVIGTPMLMETRHQVTAEEERFHYK